VYFQPQSRREPPIRLFRSDLLEALTHVHPAVVIFVWTPVIAWFVTDGWLARERTGTTAASLLLAHAIGLLVWTLVEYVLHRFVFHFSPKDPPAWLRRLIFLFHGIHHVQPWDKSRLVMPPGVSIPLALLFYALFAWVLGDVLASPAWLSPVFGAFLAGYLAYDLLHYATHHLPMNSAAGRWLKRHHLLHHHQTPDDRFGVSSPLWDVVLRTLPRREPETADERVRLG
jgi:sterol desaturase/sphingolipid hydroxylase (fatty acid hydroxylase superfamily)